MIEQTLARLATCEIEAILLAVEGDPINSRVALESAIDKLRYILANRRGPVAAHLP